MKKVFMGFREEVIKEIEDWIRDNGGQEYTRLEIIIEILDK